MLLKYSLIREVEYPIRGHATDAGIDFFMPQINEKFISDFNALKANKGARLDNEELTLLPSFNALIPSGVKVEIPFGHMGLFLNKSGVASKKDLIIGAQVVDTFYSGEIHIDLHNVGSEIIIIVPNEKLAQMVIVPVLNCDLTEVSEDMLYDWMKENEYRNESGFGSTDKKKS
jgi:dUTP pyrophosphatase